MARGASLSDGPEIEVLLATYNGEQYLRQQIDSILAQDYTNIRVLARDDGSVDGTPAILRHYAERFPGRFRLISDDDASGSAKQNFLQLMKASAAERICFADQDDVWLPDKVSRTKLAMDELETRWGTLPLLVFTDLSVVDNRLGVMHESFWAYTGIDPERIRDPAELMVHSVVTGCTCMVNRALLRLALRMPPTAFMHDRWIGLLASFLGKSGIVRAPTVLYRQHENNTLGAGRGIDTGEQSLRPFLAKIRGHRSAEGQVLLWNISQRDARAFYEEYGPELPPKKQGLLRAFLRCQTSRSRLVRIATYIRYRFYFGGLKYNLSFAVYLWRMNPDPQSILV